MGSTSAKTGEVVWTHEKLVEVICGRGECPARLTEPEREQVRAEAARLFPDRQIEALTAPDGFALSENVKISTPIAFTRPNPLCSGPAFGVDPTHHPGHRALIQATSSRNAPACPPDIKNPTEATLAPSSGGSPDNTRPRKVGTNSFSDNRCSCHSPFSVANSA
jgi:hypothetical protein